MVERRRRLRVERRDVHVDHHVVETRRAGVSRGEQHECNREGETPHPRGQAQPPGVLNVMPE